MIVHKEMCYEGNCTKQEGKARNLKCGVTNLQWVKGHQMTFKGHVFLHDTKPQPEARTTSSICLRSSGKPNIFSTGLSRMAF